MPVSEHPLVKEIEVRHFLGRAEAEARVRGIALGYLPAEGADQKARAVKAVAEIDAEYAARKAEAARVNEAMAARLGLDLGGAGALVATLEADPELFTWLCGRVNLTRAHSRPLADDE